jgi:hypothetical protein
MYRYPTVGSCHLEGHWRKYQDPEPDLESESEIRIRICTTMSRIRNIDYRYFLNGAEHVHSFVSP